jgi:GPH family glycoside/pentoside/hexuronide:cation symporter
VVLLANSWVYWFALRPLFQNGVVVTFRNLFAKGLDWAHMSVVLGNSFATVPGGPSNEINGIRWITTFVVVLAMSAAIYAAKNCRERFAKAANPKHSPIRQALKETFKNKPFMILMLFKIFQVFGERVFQGVLFYIGIYYVCQGDKNLATKLTGLAGIFGSFVGFIVLPFIKPISQKLGKRMGLIMPAAIALALMLTQPFVLTPVHPYLLLIPLLLLAPLSIVTNAMISAIVPDICDLDELEHGTRREGLFTAVVAFMYKLEISLSVLIVGYLVKFSGLDPKSLVQAPESLQRLL